MNRKYLTSDRGTEEKKPRRKMQLWKKGLLLAALVLAAFIALGAAWAGDYYRADDRARSALLSDEAVSVEKPGDGTVIFRPNGEPLAGLIFYPGGKVECTAYAPLLHELAGEGLLCVLVKMPCNLAVLDPDGAKGIPEKFPEVGDWYVGGHSLGGSMAAVHAAKHTEDYKGLLLLAAYSTEDISRSGLKVLSVRGDRDEVLSREKYSDNRENLPADTVEAVVVGGCHAQFGSYGRQDGDGEPSISGEEQIAATVRDIMDWLQRE